jgi:ribosomal-protein-alanine N-acetyltransferase
MTYLKNVQYILETARLILRTWRSEDAEAAFAISGDPAVMRFLGTGLPDSSIADVAKRIERVRAHQERYGFGLWAMIEKTAKTLVGVCGLKHLDDGPEIEVGYHLARSAWGHGYASEAAAACLRYGHQTLKIPRIAAVIHPDNVASQRVMGRIGMCFVRMGRYYNKDVMVYEMPSPPGPAGSILS